VFQVMQEYHHSIELQDSPAAGAQHRYAPTGMFLCPNKISGPLPVTTLTKSSTSFSSLIQKQFHMLRN
jgi:hypothetical protein